MKRIILPCIFMMFIGMMAVSDKTVNAFGDRKPKDEEVAFYRAGVSVPLNRLILIRKNAEYCAIKFIKIWTEFDEDRFKTYKHHINIEHDKDISTKKYAEYEAHYQGDGSGSFVTSNVKMTRKAAFWLPPEGPFRLFIYQPGYPVIECGQYKLDWEYKTFISFIPPNKYEADYGFELAPTPWTDIKEVNVFDPHVKWYRYDEKRQRVNIPIDKLWKPAEQKEGE